MGGNQFVQKMQQLTDNRSSKAMRLRIRNPNVRGRCFELRMEQIGLRLISIMHRVAQTGKDAGSSKMGKSSLGKASPANFKPSWLR
jgi:hypothetical protein